MDRDEIEISAENATMIGAGFIIVLTPTILLTVLPAFDAVRVFLLTQLALLLIVYLSVLARGIRLARDNRALQGLEQGATELHLGRMARVAGCSALMVTDGWSVAASIGNNTIDPRMVLVQFAVIAFFYAWGRLDRNRYTPSIASVAAAVVMDEPSGRR